MKVRNKITGEISEGVLLVALDKGPDAGCVLEWAEDLDGYEIVEANEIERTWAEGLRASAAARSRL